ncbi:MAG: hypothetical protein RJQ09_18800 [Cyclobacteriaceae bacterium]
MDSSNFSFEESQSFTQWYIWLLLIGLNLLFLFGIYKQAILGEAFGNKPASTLVLSFVWIPVLLITVFFFMIRLDTKINKEGVHVRFFPIHRKFKKHEWDDIREAKVRKYRPLLEYGGWGIRGIGRNRALNVKGNIGLQLVFNDGKKLLIGTQKKEELDLVIKSLRESN